ncbi:MAG: glutathione S-transferase, partial [Nitrosospira sp.]|nr:glutathione S-transferase [Nitrosospira sp.]
MKLYYSPDTSSLAEHIVLEWIGEPYEIQKVEIRPDKSPELLARNPMGAVPVLEVGDWVLTQNVAILNYLADCAPELRLAGDGTKRGRAEINRWLGFINSDMHPLFEPFFGSTSYLGDEAHVEATKSHSRQLLADRFAIVDTHLK